MDEEPPLVVDLDGTLIKTDMLFETLVGSLRRSPWILLALPFWLAAGRARLKRELARRAGTVAPQSLPYRVEVLEWLDAERRAGRRIVLATASDEEVARPIALHVGFDEVIASDGRGNLKGARKRDALLARFGERGYDYAGNERADLAVWARARRAIVVSADAGLLRAARGACAEARAIPVAPVRLAHVARALRVQQWPKNLLVLVPMLTAHRVADAASWAGATLAFVAFCLAASAVYIANDLLDLDSDRAHEAKRRRPFASGDLGLGWGAALAPLLMAGALAFAATGGPRLAGVVAAYLALGLAYSLRLKRYAVLDVGLIAVFYALRIFAGAVAIDVVVSNYLFAFAAAMFVSLALAKRHGELSRAAQRGSELAQRLPGRGYRTSHARAVGWIGAASGALAIAVFALYIGSREVTLLYRTPSILWAAAVLQLFWIARLWRLAHRGELEEDPLAFALHDPASYAVAALTLGVVYLAT
jgi:4-hydroxybenzoate polyprenyltransferase/phosphoserine phosphatase